MSAKKNFVYKLSMVVAVWGLVMISSVMIFGQQAPKQTIGVPDDWTHHRLVFSNPGTAAEALTAGKFEEWSRTVNSPRYQFQQLKRSSQQRAVAIAPDFASRMAILQQQAGNSRSLPFHGRPISLGGNPITKDWNMNLGAFSDASLTAVVGSTIDSSTLPSGSTFSLDGQTFTASDPIAASQSGTFTGNPATNQTLKITNGANSITLTAKQGTAGTQTGTFSAVPTQTTATNDSITIVNGSNTMTVTTNATGANVGGTMTNDPSSSQTGPTIKAGSASTATLALASGAGLPTATATFTGAPTNNQTITIAYGISSLVMTAKTGGGIGTITVGGTLNTGTSASTNNTLTVGAITYYFTATSCTGAATACIVVGSSTDHTAQNIEAAINDNSGECSTGTCFGDISAANSEVTASGANGFTASVTITNFYYTAVTESDTETNLSETASISQSVSNGCTSATAGTFIVGNGAPGSAANLYNALNGTSCQTTTPVPITVSSLSGGVFDVAETIYGTTSANAFSETATNFAWSAQTGNVGTANGCTGTGPYTASYQAANTAAGLAANVVAAVNACPTSANLFAVVGSGGAFTVYNNTLNSTTLTDSAGTPSIITWGSAVAGTSGSNTCSSTTAATFQVTMSDTTTTAVATELTTALNACLTANDVTLGIATGASAPHTTSSSATITITANKWAVNPGLTLGNTPSGYFAWTATSITNGTSGSSTAPNFAVDNVPADIATNLAADINTAGQGNTVGVTGTASGAQVTISASVAGSSGGAITLTDGLSNITLASPLTCPGGTPACDGTNSSTTFAYWSGSTYAIQSTLTTNIATALGDNGTITGAFAIGSTGSPSAGDVVLTYKTGGLGGNSQVLSSSFNALTGGTFSGGAPTQTAAVYPAKYSFDTTAPGLCSNSATPDYVAYVTSVPGSASQANIVAYDNIYSGCSTFGTVPTVYWSYNTGTGTVLTSPVLSGDGTTLAFVESNNPSGNSTLRLLKWNGGQGTDNDSPVAPDHLYTNTNAGNGGNTAWSSCPAASSCLISISFQAHGSTDSNSSPWYDYTSDTLWVGDDGGYLHEFTGVFNGTPGEVTTSWPVLVRSGQQLTGPVYDNAHGLIFLGSGDGYIESVNASTRAVLVSAQIGTAAVDIGDSPIVDPAAGTAGTVYAFVSHRSSGSSAVYQFAEGSISGGSGAHENIGTGSTGSTPLYAGDFDNTYYSSSNEASPGGHLWVCGNTTSTPILYEIPITINAMGTPGATTYTLSAATTPCSPVTEFYDGTSDFIFVSPQTQGATADQGCTANEGCVISFTVSGTAATRSGSGAFPGGASGMIIDTQNTTVGGTKEIYFGILGSQSCTGAGGAGTGTGGCAIQASQATPSP